LKFLYYEIGVVKGRNLICLQEDYFEMKKIAVLGDGGWGTALAILLSENGYNVYLWSNFPEYAAELQEKRENIKFLRGVSLPAEIKIGSNLKNAVEGSEIIVLAVPSRFMRSICRKVRNVSYTKAMCLLNVAKGMEVDSLNRMSQIIAEEMPGVPIAVLSGPSHAEEVARRLPTAVVTASSDLKLARYIQNVFMNNRFRVYTSEDVIGVELCGALKNVIAIAVGICDGLKLGDNPKAALMTRGIAEITRLSVAMGGKRETSAGLAGIGDVIVTCISNYGRNLNFGRMLGKGKTMQDALAGTEMVVEGVYTSEAAYKMSRKYNIELPITNEIYQILYKNKSYKQVVQDLMLRSPKPEAL